MFLPDRKARFGGQADRRLLDLIQLCDLAPDPPRQAAAGRFQGFVELPPGVGPAPHRGHGLVRAVSPKQTVVTGIAVGLEIFDQGTGQQLFSHLTRPGGSIFVIDRWMRVRIPTPLIAAEGPEIAGIALSGPRRLDPQRSFVHMRHGARPDVFKQLLADRAKKAG